MTHVETVYRATKGVTIKFPSERGTPVYVQFTHQQFAWLAFMRHLYESGEFSDALVKAA